MERNILTNTKIDYNKVKSDLLDSLMEFLSDLKKNNISFVKFINLIDVTNNERFSIGGIDLRKDTFQIMCYIDWNIAMNAKVKKLSETYPKIIDDEFGFYIEWVEDILCYINIRETDFETLLRIYDEFILGNYITTPETNILNIFFK
jgi:hypothetical protein